MAPLGSGGEREAVCGAGRQRWAAAVGRGTDASPTCWALGERGFSRPSVGLRGHPYQAFTDPPCLLCLQQLPELPLLQELGSSKEGFPSGLQSSRDWEMTPPPRRQDLGVPGQSRGAARVGGPNRGLRHLQALLRSPWGLQCSGLCGHAPLLSSAGSGRAGVGNVPAYLLSCFSALSPPQGLRSLVPN